MIESGTVLQDRFLIEKELARGGMGAVYLATDQKFGSRVAIKERFYEDAQLAEAFAREARILNCLHHPILPHVSDYFSEDGGQFLVMEYIEGEDLSEILKREGKAFPVTDVVRWMLELLDGLDFLHSQDPPIVHRDIKPGNLKLTSRGNLVLLDFGLAKETSGNNQGVRSVFGYSRRYSPLEQIEGAGTSPRSDIFSLGATAYHLITGEAPVDVLARASAIVAGRPDPLRLASEINAEVGVPMAQVIYRAMALNPEQRFASAHEMHAALYDVLDDEPAEQRAAADYSAEMFVPAAAIESPNVVAGSSSRSEHAIPDNAGVAARASTPKDSIAGKPFRTSTTAAAAVVLLALLVIGYSLISFWPSGEANEQVSGASEPPADTSQIAPEPEVREPAELQVNEPEISQAETLSETPVETEPVKEERVLREKDSVAKRAEKSKRDTDEEGETNEKLEAKTATEKRAQRRVKPAFPPPARRTPRQRDVYEPPVSSIEMIFTGIPNERRRRSRQSQPY